MKMSLVKIPKLSDIYYFCSKLLPEDNAGEEGIQLIQSNMLNVKRLGAFLQNPWPIDKRVNEPEILPYKAAYLTYHLFEGSYFSQRKFLFSLWCGISMMEFNGAKMDKKVAKKELAKMMKLYSRKRGPLFCKDLLKKFFLDSFSKNDKFKAFGSVGQLFPRLI